MTEAPSIRMRLEGVFEDGFLYMDQLLAVRDDRTLVQADLASLVRTCFPESFHDIAEMFLTRNDFLEHAGAKRLLAIPEVRSAVGVAGALNATVEISDDEWLATDDFGQILPSGDVLDLCVYYARLFIATTRGMLHSDLDDTGRGIRLTRAVKRTDARCLSVTARYGSAVASCGGEGLLVSFDEFDQLKWSGRSKPKYLDSQSIRTGWLGYHLINYETPTRAKAFHSEYERTPRFSSPVIQGMTVDQSLLKVETEEERNGAATFSFNNHRTFFTRFDDGTYNVRERRWHGGRLGPTQRTYMGRIDQPVSAHYCTAGLVVETFDQVALITPEGISSIYDGQAVAVRTFPNSKHFKNLVMIVAEDSLHLISPLG